MEPEPKKSFIKDVFSDGGQGSASRVLTALHSLVACACLAHVVAHTHAVPDAVTLTGLGGFATVPYAINQIKNAVNPKSNS